MDEFYTQPESDDMAIRRMLMADLEALWPQWRAEPDTIADAIERGSDVSPLLGAEWGVQHGPTGEGRSGWACWPISD